MLQEVLLRPLKEIENLVSDADLIERCKSYIEKKYICINISTEVQRTPEYAIGSRNTFLRGVGKQTIAMTSRSHFSLLNENIRSERLLQDLFIHNDVDFSDLNNEAIKRAIDLGFHFSSFDNYQHPSPPVMRVDFNIFKFGEYVANIGLFEDIQNLASELNRAIIDHDESAQPYFEFSLYGVNGFLFDMYGAAWREGLDGIYERVKYLYTSLNDNPITPVMYLTNKAKALGMAVFGCHSDEAFVFTDTIHHSARYSSPKIDAVDLEWDRARQVHELNECILAVDDMYAQFADFKPKTLSLWMEMSEDPSEELISQIKTLKNRNLYIKQLMPVRSLSDGACLI